MNIREEVKFLLKENFHISFPNYRLDDLVNKLIQMVKDDLLINYCYECGEVIKENADSICEKCFNEVSDKLYTMEKRQK